MTDDLSMMTDLDGYAASQGVSTRTVRRWVERGELPGVRKIHGRWSIPVQAERQTPSQTMATIPAPHPPVQMATIQDMLASQPAFLDLGVASQLLGVSVKVLLANKEAFGLVPYGDAPPHGGRRAWVCPQSTIRKVLG